MIVDQLKFLHSLPLPIAVLYLAVRRLFKGASAGAEDGGPSRSDAARGLR